jgi:hypothetical protein
MQVLHAFETEGRPDAFSILGAPMSTNDSDTYGEIVLGQHGGRRPGSGRPKKGEVRPPKQPKPPLLKSGTSDYVVARLKRDAAAGCRDAGILLNGIYAGLITAHTAACEMSYVRRREVTGRGSPNVGKKIDWALHKLFRKSKHTQENAPGVASSVEGKEEEKIVTAE